jgi:predicted aspartyl protease
VAKVLTIYALLILPALALNPYFTPTLRAVSARDKDSTSLPFDQANNLIVVTATLNGKGPFRFVLDTGASVHVMSPELAQSLALRVETNTIVVDTRLPAKTSAGVVRVSDLRLGDFTLKQQTFAVTPLPPSYPFNGFIGAELFKHFVVRVDFRQSQVVLTRRNAFRYQGKGISVAIKLHEGLLPQVQAAVDDNVGWFKLDTGYNGFLALFGEFIEQHNLLAKYGSQRSSPGGETLTGDVGVTPIAQIHKFSLGDVALDNLETSFFIQKGGSNSAFSGAIGTAALKQFDVIFDYKGQRIILERRKGTE